MKISISYIDGQVVDIDNVISTFIIDGALCFRYNDGNKEKEMGLAKGNWMCYVLED